MDEGRSFGRQHTDTTRAYQVVLSHRDQGGSLAGAFTGDEAFAAYLTLGDGMPAAATLIAEWEPDEAGNPATLAEPIVRITVETAAIASLTPGIYFVRCILDPGTTDLDVLDGVPTTIELVAGIGEGEPPATYASLDDMRRECPWLDRVMAAMPGGKPDFLEQRASARHWLDEAILAAGPSGVSWLSAPLGTEPGSGRSRWLREQLAADALLVTPTVRRVVSLYAVGLALAGSESDDLRKRAAAFFARAAAEAVCCEIALDTDGDGVGDVPIDLSRVRSIRG